MQDPHWVISHLVRSFMHISLLNPATRSISSELVRWSSMSGTSIRIWPFAAAYSLSDGRNPSRQPCHRDKILSRFRRDPLEPFLRERLMQAFNAGQVAPKRFIELRAWRDHRYPATGDDLSIAM